MATRKDNKQGLTPKQEMFCRYYVETGFASEAYRMAYNTANMKPKTVNEAACRLLSDCKIRARVAELEAEYAEQSKANRQEVEAVMMDIVKSDTADMYEVDEVTGKVKMKTPHRLPKRVRRAIKTIRNNRGVVSYDLQSKTEAANWLAKVNGWEAPKKVEMGGNMAIEGKHVMDFSGLPEDDEPEQ